MYQGDMDCTMANREGIYRRKKKYHDFDPFSNEMYFEINKARNRVLNIVSDYMKKQNRTGLYSR